MLKHPIIVFEGHDRSLKTTIADSLAEYYKIEPFMSNSKESFVGIEYIEDNTSALSMFNYYVARFASSMLRNGLLKNKPIIIYRSFMSEIVYSNLLNRETDSYYNDLTNKCLKRSNALFVVCKSKRDKYNDELLNDDEINKSIKIYDKIIKSESSSNIFELDTSERKVDSYVKILIEKIEGRN